MRKPLSRKQEDKDMMKVYLPIMSTSPTRALSDQIFPRPYFSFFAVHCKIKQWGSTALFSRAFRNCRRFAPNRFRDGMLGPSQLEATSAFQKNRNRKTKLTNVHRECHHLYSTNERKILKKACSCMVPHGDTIAH